MDGKKKREQIVIGILAHVDAGKTTLSEGLLYAGGRIRQMGRVDRRDTYLDTDEMERARGITIYAKQAVFSSPSRDRDYTILDTPGHADFSAEMERTLAVLDAAVLMISAADGINAQVRLLWELLKHHQVPTFLFINKMDQAESAGEGPQRRQDLMREILQVLSSNAVDMTDGDTDGEIQETLALASDKEELLELVMGGGRIPDEVIRELIRERKCFPVMFGSALKMQGVDTLLKLLDCYAVPPDYDPDSELSARVIKITRSAAGERETVLKITGGTISVRQVLRYRPPFTEQTEQEDEEEETDYLEEKITQIRQYSGDKYNALPNAGPGTVCAVTGLSATYAGQGIGQEQDETDSLLAPVLAWQVILPPDADVRQAYRQLKLLEEEEPMLQLSFHERKREIRAHMMGEVQREILSELARRRFGLEIRFGLPSVIYKETIAAPVEGVGHFEPLRHYAEVHLLLEPGEEGSGLVFEDRCPPDTLAGQYRRQILSELAKRRHRGVLTGSALTDVRISLVGGRAHVKHTCGGDFRQAAYRALRQGLMMARNILLEPCYAFVIAVPDKYLGRTLTDLQQMGGIFGPPEKPDKTNISAFSTEDVSQISGQAPVAAMDAWREIFAAYTRGEGRLQLRTGPYRPCADADRVIAEEGYDPEADRWQPSDSVFCMHGAGTRVPWYLVRDYMHVEGSIPAAVRDEMNAYTEWLRQEQYGADPAYRQDDPGEYAAEVRGGKKQAESFRQREKESFAAEEELRAIFERTYGPVRKNVPARETAVYSAASPSPREYRKGKPRPEKAFLLVDGYNIIHAWDQLRDLAAQDLQAARDSLLEILSDYAGYADPSVICVFDAYKVPGGQERVFRYHNIDVVFTKEAETADQYIEKTAHELTGKYAVSVATSDGLEQIIIFGAGAQRISARELLAGVMQAKEEMRERLTEKAGAGTGRFGERLADKLPEGENYADASDHR